MQEMLDPREIRKKKLDYYQRDRKRMITTIPNSTDTSAGYKLHLLIMSLYKQWETAPGANPPGASRFYFLFGCLVWNIYAIMNPVFPFVDGFTCVSCNMSPTANEDAQWALFYNMLGVGFQYLKQYELPSLQLLDPPTTPFPFIKTFFEPAIQAYFLRRSQDGYRTTETYHFPNENYYIEIGTDTVQNLNEYLPSPSTWCPLDTHFEDGHSKRQTPLQPFFSQVQNWFSAAQWETMYDIADTYYPSEGLFQAQEIVMVNLQPNLTEDQKLKAEIWAGSTPGLASPPSKWMILLALVLACNSMRLKESVALIGGIGFCMFHSGVCAWGIKYKYNQARPIQAIRRDYLGQQVFEPINETLVDGGVWLPYQQPILYTPPFPDYVSGHSTFSMACATFFQMILGSDTIPMNADIDCSYFKQISEVFDPLDGTTLLSALYLPPQCSLVDPNLPMVPIYLNWNSWVGLAQEIGISRVTGGIHWENSNLGGLVVGAWVGRQILTASNIPWDNLGLDF